MRITEVEDSDERQTCSTAFQSLDRAASGKNKSTQVQPVRQLKRRLKRISKFFSDQPNMIDMFSPPPFPSRLPHSSSLPRTKETLSVFCSAA